jgi:hypothetical protein
MCSLTIVCSKQPPKAPLPPPGPSVYMDVEVEWQVPLVQVAGISSSYIAQMEADASKEGMWEAKGCEELYLWGSDGQGGETPLADGGGVDNAAIHAALRRGARTILSCYANGSPLPAALPLDAARLWDLAGLFGAVPDGQGPKMGSGTIDARVFNKHVQVFETAMWAELGAGIARCVTNSHPVVVPLRLRVLENSAQGVQGGWEAHVIFVFNSMPKAWHASLPEETRDALATSDELKGFPYIPTSKLDYDPDLASYLSQLASWNMIQALPTLRAVLQRAQHSKPSTLNSKLALPALL